MVQLSLINNGLIRPTLNFAAASYRVFEPEPINLKQTIAISNLTKVG